MSRIKGTLIQTLIKHILNPQEIIPETIKLDRNRYTVILFINEQYELVARQEILEFSNHKYNYTNAGCDVIIIYGNSHTHLQYWLEELKSESGFYDGIRLLSDNTNIYARDFGILKDGKNAESYSHGIFIIDSNKKVCYHNILANGIPHNSEDCLRLVNAFKATDTNHVLAPADWKNHGNSIHNNSDFIKNFFMKRKSRDMNTWEVEEKGEVINNVTGKQIKYNEKDHPLRKTAYPTKVDWMKFSMFAITIFPLRLLILLVSIFFGYIISCIGLMGMSQEKPLTGYRVILKKICYFIMRIKFATIGIYTIKQKGIQEPPTVAPIILAAPHTSYFDGPVIMASYENMPMVLSKQSVLNIPVYGKFWKFLQFIGVDRTSESSKEECKAEIKKRILSKDGWQHLLILPEGTTTNGKSIMRFKLGPFLTPVIIQPILIRYKNKLNTLSSREYGRWGSIFLPMCQLLNYVELEFLPLYTPNEDERQDPLLFADNVKNVMANHLGIPVCPRTFGELNVNGTFT